MQVCGTVIIVHFNHNGSDTITRRDVNYQGKMETSEKKWFLTNIVSEEDDVTKNNQ